MHKNRDNALRRHCVLPFGAEPGAVPALRRAVGRQLAAWDASAVTDVAQLAVTELAANVIKHVGEGTAATLVMEDEAGCLRIEMHDTSPVLPTCRQATPDQEAGRGIALVTAITDGWFCVSTAAGKAVCCEVSYSARKPDNAHNRERISRAMAFVEAYALYWRSPETHPLRSAPAVAEVATDLITDLICWLADKGYDPDDILDRAQTHFEAEQLTEA
ncbi:ATP-binding protein [Actinacidiphila oryziradicis]|uniref:ATP-binding protein n=1 Tax=Actinacidiphila oryziradicis TaxID=2571141 RepID=A0A4V5MXG6_9ACTN|nr:ATP-binding protein [Actinacidiphila oryziradicis]TKA00179.1 ATP-binding protein [Actinacidiphila oryziradicis]